MLPLLYMRLFSLCLLSLYYHTQLLVGYHWFHRIMWIWQLFLHLSVQIYNPDFYCTLQTLFTSMILNNLLLCQLSPICLCRAMSHPGYWIALGFSHLLTTQCLCIVIILIVVLTGEAWSSNLVTIDSTSHYNGEWWDCWRHIPESYTEANQ